MGDSKYISNRVTFFLVGKIRRKQAATNALSAMVTNRMM